MLLFPPSPKDERAIASKFLKGHVDLSKLDSGRNKRIEVAGDQANHDEEDAPEVEDEIEPIQRPPAPKKRKVAKQRQ